LVFKNQLQVNARSKQQLASLPEQADAYRVAKIRLNQQKSATALWIAMGTCWI
jgi:hypothetical protein